MNENSDRLDPLRKRTKEYSLRIIKLYSALPKKDEVSKTIGKQILRSGTSVGAQFRESCRAKSNADLVNKLEGCLQELDETMYWLELLLESGIFSEDKLKLLMQETDELTAIFVASVKKIKSK